MKCLNCQKDTENPKFCSLSCSASHNNKIPKRPRTPTYCPQCNKEFYDKAGRLEYCSCACRSDAKFAQNVSETNCYYPPTGSPGTKALRSYLIRKFGNHCMICNNPGEWNGLPMTLIVDHINGHADDWSVTNIRLVCPNCDSQLPTFKGRNKGNSTRKYTITQK